MMPDERPSPAHTRDGAAVGVPDAAPALRAVVEDAPEGIFQPPDAEVREFVELVRLLESFRVCPEKSGTFIVTKDKLAQEYLRVTHKIPTVGVIKVCEFVASQCRPMQASKAVEMALNRMYGAVAQKVNVTITPDQAARMSESEIDGALRKMGVQVELLN